MLESSITQKLKSRIWQRYGSEQFPAEWDGNVWGGGKLSQRFWEYFKALELLELNQDSVVLDIGGGSPSTGMGFFASLIAPHVKKVVIMDPNVNDDAEKKVEQGNVDFVRKNANYQDLKETLQQYPELTRVASISVFEHIEPEVREEIIQAVDENFLGERFVATFEYHAKICHFPFQLTTKTTSQMFRHFTRFYLDKMEASPVWCENAFDEDRVFKFNHDNKFLKRYPKIEKSETPRWYPLAVRFERI